MSDTNVIEFNAIQLAKRFEEFLTEKAGNQHSSRREEMWQRQYGVEQNANDDQCPLMRRLSELLSPRLEEAKESAAPSPILLHQDIPQRPHTPTPESFQRIYDSLVKAENNI
jgi:hypothetical protein